MSTETTPPADPGQDPAPADPAAVETVEDFDAYWRAQDRRGQTVRVFGQEVTLPPSLPLQFELEAKRVGSSTNDADVRRMVGLLFGDESLDAWSAAGMDAEQFAVLLLWASARVSQPGRNFTMADAHQLYRDQLAKKAGAGKAPKKPRKKQKRATSGRS